jgi:hypothetical protein
MSDFSQPVGGHYNYNGFELGVGVSWLFGGGGAAMSPPTPSKGIRP